MKIFLPLLFFFSLVAGAQKIKVNQYDANKKQWRVESFPVNLKSAAAGKMDVLLRSVGDSFSLVLSGSGIGVNTVIAGDALIFLLDDDSTVVLKSPAVQLAERTAYRHEYIVTANDLEILSRHNLQALRKYSTEGYDDVYPEKQAASKLKELSALFLSELKKADILKAKSAAGTPGFPGGKEVLLRFFNRNVKPLAGLQAGERKFVMAEFQVAADGSVNGLTIRYPAGEPFDKEALRLLARMPKWKPATENGRQIDATVMQPLTFVQEEKSIAIRF